MRATFAGLEIGRTGLTVSQLGLDVTSHNIANVETKGYTRQRIVQTAYDPFATIGRALPVSEALVGGGVRVQILDQIRSAYLDRRFRTENTTNAYWQKRTEGLTYLESYFDNVNEETSLNFSISEFFKAIKVLSTDPVENAQRKLLQTAGLDLVQQFNGIYDGLVDLQSTQNLAVKVTVEDINRIAEDIVELNKSIYAFEATGYIANDLRDKRNLLLDELSSLIDIDYSEEPDGRGGVKLVVEIGGKTLLDHDIQNKLGVVLRDNPIPGEEQVWVPVWASNLIPGPDDLGNYITKFTGLDGARHDLTLIGVDVTDLAAVQAAVDRVNEITSLFAKVTPEWADCVEYTDLLGKETAGTITPAEADRLDELRAVMDEPVALLNELQGLVANVEIFPMETVPGWEWCVHTGISIGGAPLVYACSDEVKPVSNRGRALIEFGPDDVPPEDLVVKGGELKAYLDMRDSMDAKTPGIPYYIEMINNLARALVQEINEVHRQGWTDNPDGSETGINFFDELAGMVWEDGAGHRLTLNEDGDWVDYLDTIISDPEAAGYTEEFDLSLITAKNINLSKEVSDSVYNIACSTTKIVKHGEPDELQRGNNENMNVLYELFLKKDISLSLTRNGVTSIIDIGSLDGYATAIRFDVGTTLSFANKTADNSTVLLTAAENQRISVSGVSLDEEMINMVKYQHAYSGASRVITVMDEMLDKLINGTGRVGL